jgi:cell division septal protein FtsQ
LISALKKISIAVLVIGIFVIALFSMKIQHVKIEGNSRVSDAELVAAIFGDEMDKNALVLYTKEKMGIHKKINYVNDYYISWESPFSIVIDVHEKPSIAYVRRDLKNVYFDKDGIINDVTENKIGNIVEVSGITFKSYEKGQKIEARDMKTVNAILNITNSLYENDLPARYLDISRDGDISVFVGNITVVLGDTKNMEIKLQRLADIYKEIKDLKGTLYLSNARENMLDEQYIFKKDE